MSITSTTAEILPTFAQYTDWKNGLDRLVRAVQSGNLVASRQAYAALRRQFAESRCDAETDHGTSLTRTIDQIGTALQFGNIHGAQQAVSAL